MCLAVPGKIECITNNEPFSRSGKVNFSGIVKDVNLAYVPEASVGDYVVVHVGFALSTMDETEARQVFKYLKSMNELKELDER